MLLYLRPGASEAEASMKCFILGSLGAVLMMFAAMVIIAQYSDYTARSQSGAWLFEVEPVKQAIERIALDKKALADIQVEHDKAKVFAARNVELFSVDSRGQIFIRGGKDAQFLVLTPSPVDGKVTWRCTGGSVRSVPKSCRE